MDNSLDFNKRQKEKFIAYIRQLGLEDNIKDYFLNDDFFSDDDSPDAYLHYAELFKGGFDTELDQQTVTHLNIAAFLYYRSILIQDAFIDSDDDKLDAKSLLLSSICQEESIKILGSIFSLDSPFWTFWNTRRNEYLTAIRLDQMMANTEFTWESFEMIADCRSAFGKVAVDLWFVAANEQEPVMHEKLLKSHKKFSAGFQIIDDIQDFQSDLGKTQLNVAHHFLRIDLARKDLKYEALEPELLHKYFYVLGTCERLIEKASQYLSEALTIAQETGKNLPLWTKFIQVKEREAITFNLHLNAYKKTLLAEARSSKVHRIERTHTINEAEIEKSLEKVSIFLKDHLNNQGYWEEIYLNAGLSDVWITGLISSLLNESTSFDKESDQRVVSFLKENQNDDGFWGYNREWVSDVDSTTCALLSLHFNGSELQESLDKWLTLQREDGGFSTYMDKGKIDKVLNYTVKSVEGWMNSHVCVSALGYYLLSHFEEYSQAKIDLKDYLFKALREDNIWQSYWWTSPVYATCFTLKALMNEGIEQDLIKSSLKHLISKVSPQGMLGDQSASLNIFYSGILLSTICHETSLYHTYEKEAKSLTEDLIYSQYDDGSFPSSICLRVPAPNVVNPEEVYSWRLGETSTNIVTTDKMRLLSSAAAYNGILSYAQRQKM